MKNINKLKTARRIKILFAVVASYFVVSLGVPRVFVADSSQFQAGFIVWLRLTPQRVYAYIRYPFDRGERVNSIENASLDTVNREDKKELEYNPVSEGVYAAEDPETKERFIKIEERSDVEIHYIKLSDGREVKVYVPVK